MVVTSLQQRFPDQRGCESMFSHILQNIDSLPSLATPHELHVPPSLRTLA